MAPYAAEGMWGIEIKLTAGDRLLQGGLNLGGGFQENGGINGWGAFNIDNPRNEPQEVTVQVDAYPLITAGYAPEAFAVNIRLLQRQGQVGTPVGDPVSGRSPLALRRVVNPGFYILEVRSALGSPRGVFQMAATTKFVDRNGGGFQGGAVVGGYLPRNSARESLHGYSAFCIRVAQAVSFQTFGRLSYLGVGASELSLMLKDRDARVFWESPAAMSAANAKNLQAARGTVTENVLDIADAYYPRDFSKPPTAATAHSTAPSEQLVFPHVADGGGYKTSLRLTNQSALATTAMVSFFNDQGEELNVKVGGTTSSNFTLMLPALGAATLETTGDSETVATGWAKVVAFPPAEISGDALFQLFSDRHLVSEASVPAVLPTRTAGFYVEDDGGGNTGFAISNPGESMAAGTLTLRNMAGEEIGSAPINLGPRQHRAAFLFQIFPKVASGRAEISLTSGSLAISALRFQGSSAFRGLAVEPPPNF